MRDAMQQFADRKAVLGADVYVELLAEPRAPAALAESWQTSRCGDQGGQHGIVTRGRLPVTKAWQDADAAEC